MASPKVIAKHLSSRPLQLRSRPSDLISEMIPPKVIVTHNGAFHCDEVLAVHILRQTEKYSGSTLIRSRNRSVIAGADVAVDVGGEYDLAKCRFDHHQRGFDEVFGPKNGLCRNRTKMSSAGLIYKHFGMETIGNILQAADVVLTSKELKTTYYKVYSVFVESVDAIDNGFAQYDSTKSPRYYIGSDLSSRVDEKNADWNEPSGDEEQKLKFEEALTMVGTEFNAAVMKTAKCWLPARRVLNKSMDERTKYDSAGRVLVLQNWVPWKGHLMAREYAEAKAGVSRPVHFAIYTDMSDESWRMMSVKAGHESLFEMRTLLPEEWRGLNGSRLSEVTGIEDCIFVHQKGYTGGHKTLEGALQMVQKALEIFQ